MEVYALVGRRGTGKSHHAQLLAHHYGINYLLDDGLLIKGSQILAGRSAKRENTRYGAIKRALLHDDEHARQLRDRLKELTPSKLLILATSERMAEVIAGRLEVPPPHRYIHIEDIASPEAIEKARQMRNEKNRHVIPLPTFSIKKEFPGYIVDPLRSFFRLPSPQQQWLWSVIVRPFTAIWAISISPSTWSANWWAILPELSPASIRRIASRSPQKRENDSHVDLVFSLKSLPAKNLHRAAAEVQRLRSSSSTSRFLPRRINVTVKKIFQANN